MSIRRIRLAVRQGRYAYSVHALEEMDDDRLLESDVNDVVMRGKIVAKLTDDPRVGRVSSFAGPPSTEKLKLRWFADFSRREFCV